ncbi:entericidin A/B family lipoprotein [Pasteurellaceae bacterium TAE3-ERU1]|nr:MULTISPECIES: entericidin A/B family lipoprotein [Spirabiliibacterium]MBE2894190.1 entericidin A/B family lipoprotein [Spirabiliibacterium falconis]MBE2896610.1 entericidin A/B family lipoprotein [Spirabiliibacterium pneumoniae]MBE2898585.1 entericidin A/B family lipoprotein [Spirabiliibacterium mucosae]MBV7387741.1 entericidin A/B family lipoprotein [Pasteurellaceae bacterium TAE3-ERU1]
MKMIWAVIFALTVGSLTACNTVKGAGEDVSAAGQAINNTASDVQKSL